MDHTNDPNHSNIWSLNFGVRDPMSSLGRNNENTIYRQNMHMTTMLLLIFCLDE